MSTDTYAVHTPLGTLRLVFDEDGTKTVEGGEEAKTYLEMAMLGHYTPQGLGLTFTTLEPDTLMAMEGGNIVVVPPFDEVVRQAIESSE